MGWRKASGSPGRGRGGAGRSDGLHLAEQQDDVGNVQRLRRGEDGELLGCTMGYDLYVVGLGNGVVTGDGAYISKDATSTPG